MGRYTTYIKDIWKLQASRKVVGLTLFGVIYQNDKPFTPGDQLEIMPGVEDAISTLVRKGYDFLIVTGQPPVKTRALDVKDFENILAATRGVFEQRGGRIKNVYYAPGTDKSDPYVKPNSGMFDRAQNEGMVQWKDSVYVGAETNDIRVANKVGTESILIKPKNSALKTKAFELTQGSKFKEFESLLDFANSL